VVSELNLEGRDRARESRVRSTTAAMADGSRLNQAWGGAMQTGSREAVRYRSGLMGPPRRWNVAGFAWRRPTRAGRDLGQAPGIRVLLTAGHTAKKRRLFTTLQNGIQDGAEHKQAVVHMRLTSYTLHDLSDIAAMRTRLQYVYGASRRVKISFLTNECP